MNNFVSYNLETGKSIDLVSNTKYVVLSDLHLGAGGNNDNSLKNNLFLFTALKYYYENRFTVILNGDTFDLAESSLNKIEKAHEDIMWILQELYERDQLVILKGNHDASLKEKNLKIRPFSYSKKTIPFLSNITIYDYANLDDYIIMHGHQNSFFYTFLNPAVTLLIRYLWAPLERFLLKDPTSEEFNSNERMEKDFEIEGKIVIVGHSHSLTIHPNFINEGCGIFPRCITALELTPNPVPVKWSFDVEEDTVKVRRKEITN